MKVTQSPETGRLIVDGEGEIIYINRAIPSGDPVGLVTGFIIRPSEKSMLKVEAGGRGRRGCGLL